MGPTLFSPPPPSLFSIFDPFSRHAGREIQIKGEISWKVPANPTEFVDAILGCFGI